MGATEFFLGSLNVNSPTEFLDAKESRKAKIKVHGLRKAGYLTFGRVDHLKPSMPQLVLWQAGKDTSEETTT